MISLSIIIPCYNVEAYLPKTIHSLSQLNNADNCEFIFINDGSTDSTGTIIDNFVRNDKRARGINQANKGVSAARNAGIAIAQGDYILCLDGDDYLQANSIDIIIQGLGGTDALIAPCVIENQAGTTSTEKLAIKAGIYTVDQLYSSCEVFPTAPQLIYKADIIREYQLRFNSTIKSGEVYDFTVSFLEHANNIAVINEGFYHYVMRESSATHLPNYAADMSALNILDHFSSIALPWASSSSFLLTEFKIITSFTYNKYLRKKLTDNQTIQTINMVLTDSRVKKILTVLSHSDIGIKHRLHVWYLRFMPIGFGYKMLALIMRMLKH